MLYYVEHESHRCSVIEARDVHQARKIAQDEYGRTARVTGPATNEQIAWIGHMSGRALA